jgi:protease-4
MLNFFKTLFLPITATLGFIQKYFKSIVFITLLIIFFGDSSKQNLQVANLQKIDLTGTIMSSDKILEQINKAKKDTNIKGVLLNVNSPGGAVAPSIEIAYAIKELNKLKPVVAYASGTMASGSYYASIWANKIIANPGSMIGSIGVIFQGANIQELMKTLGVKAQTIKAGTYKESGTFTRQWNEAEKAELNLVIKDTYNTFINDVANARKLDVKDHKTFADAHIFTASQAKKVKLIDEVATLSYAKDQLIKLSKVNNPIWEKEDKFDKFMDSIIQKTISNFSVYFMANLKAQL